MNTDSISYLRVGSTRLIQAQLQIPKIFLVKVLSRDFGNAPGNSLFI